MKKMSILLLCAFSCLLFLGCQKKAIHYPIRILAYTEEQEVLEEIVENFKKTFAPVENEITITYIDINETNSINVDFYRDYDIFPLQHYQLEKLVEKKIIVENSLHARRVQVYNAAGAAKAADHKGRFFNFPYTGESYLLFFDNRVYNDEDVKELKKMFLKEKDSDRFSLGINFNDPYALLSFYFAGKVTLFSDWNIFSVTLDSEQGIEITRYISKLKSNGVGNVDYNEAAELFEKKQLSALIAPVKYVDLYKKALKDRFAVAILPELFLECTNSSFNLRPTVDIKAYAVNINAKSLSTSSELCYYITSSPAQYLRFQKKKVYPTNKEIKDKKDLKEDKVVSTHLEQLKYAVPPPTTEKLKDFWIEFPKLMVQLYEGNVYNIEDKIKELTNKVRNA